jgi:hypothetical protein
MTGFGKSRFMKNITSKVSSLLSSSPPKASATAPPPPQPASTSPVPALNITADDDNEVTEVSIDGSNLPDISPRRGGGKDDEPEDWIATEGTVKPVIPPSSPGTALASSSSSSTTSSDSGGSFWSRVGGWFSSVGKKLDEMTEGFEADHEKKKQGAKK